MGRLTREFDWSKTSIGTPDLWPQSLRTIVAMIISSKFPMFLWWGDDLIQFYNDAYRPSLGNNGKHPLALGQNGADCWPEAWDIISPLIEQVLSTGESTWSEDQLVPIYRNGKIEDVYWTFSYSPIKGESENIEGVLVVCTETTDKVVNLKQLGESKDQLQFAIDAAELGTWDYNPVSNTFTGNDRLKEWFGLAINDEIDLGLAINIMAEKDRLRVMEAIQNALIFSSGGLYDIEYIIINPVTKQERIVRAKGRAWFNDEKRAYRFNGTLQDVTKETLAKIELEMKNRELIRVNTDLDNFIYTASHDLKAPVSNLEGLLQAHAADSAFNEEQQCVVGMMFDSIERFKTTIHDLTEISKIQRIDATDLQTLNFATVLTEVKLDIRELIERFAPLIQTDFEVQEINYSRKNLRSIIYNLLSNALKYSAPHRKPVVKIYTKKIKDFTILTVADNGLGLSAENQNKIFGMFKRAHQHVEGSGIGLYMIKRMVENHGGKIEIKSEIDKGTTFIVYLKNS